MMKIIEKKIEKEDFGALIIRAVLLTIKKEFDVQIVSNGEKFTVESAKDKKNIYGYVVKYNKSLANALKNNNEKKFTKLFFESLVSHANNCIKYFFLAGLWLTLTENNIPVWKPEENIKPEVIKEMIIAAMPIEMKN